jgi:hypothetical protein
MDMWFGCGSGNLHACPHRHLPVWLVHHVKHRSEQICIAWLTQSDIIECMYMYAGNRAVLVCLMRPCTVTCVLESVDLEGEW